MKTSTNQLTVREQAYRAVRAWQIAHSAPLHRLDTNRRELVETLTSISADPSTPDLLKLCQSANAARRALAEARDLPAIPDEDTDHRWRHALAEAAAALDEFRAACSLPGGDPAVRRLLSSGCRRYQRAVAGMGPVVWPALHLDRMRPAAVPALAR